MSAQRRSSSSSANGPARTYSPASGPSDATSSQSPSAVRRLIGFQGGVAGTRSRPAIETLRRVATRSAGQLVDALFDPDEEFAVRRRLPRVLAAARGARARDGLVAALADPRFEVRYHTARALVILLRDGPTLPAEPVFAAVRRELEVSEQAWRDLRIIDAVDERGADVAGDDAADVAALLHDRSNRGLEHVFTLLELVLPAETVRLAFRALHTDDRALRGTALEYLEQVLPTDIRLKLWPLIADGGRAPAPARPHAEVVAELVRSQAAVLGSLRELARAKP